MSTPKKTRVPDRNRISLEKNAGGWIIGLIITGLISIGFKDQWASGCIYYDLLHLINYSIYWQFISDLVIPWRKPRREKHLRQSLYFLFFWEGGNVSFHLVGARAKLHSLAIHCTRRGLLPSISQKKPWETWLVKTNIHTLRILGRFWKKCWTSKKFSGKNDDFQHSFITASNFIDGS